MLNSTIGFITGAASRNAMPTERGRPFACNWRTDRHHAGSQTGEMKPAPVPTSTASSGLRGTSGDLLRAHKDIDCAAD